MIYLLWKLLGGEWDGVGREALSGFPLLKTVSQQFPAWVSKNSSIGTKAPWFSVVPASPISMEESDGFLQSACLRGNVWASLSLNTEAHRILILKHLIFKLLAYDFVFFLEQTLSSTRHTYSQSLLHFLLQTIFCSTECNWIFDWSEKQHMLCYPSWRPAGFQTKGFVKGLTKEYFGW